MDFELIAGGSALLLILALVQVIKTVFSLDTKFAPIAAIILGLIFSIAYSFYGETVTYEAIIRGLIVGLSAIGIYSGTKNTVQAFHK